MRDRRIGVLRTRCSSQNRVKRALGNSQLFWSSHGRACTCSLAPNPHTTNCQRCNTSHTLTTAGLITYSPPISGQIAKTCEAHRRALRGKRKESGITHHHGSPFPTPLLPGCHQHNHRKRHSHQSPNPLSLSLPLSISLSLSLSLSLDLAPPPHLPLPLPLPIHLPLPLSLVAHSSRQRSTPIACWDRPGDLACARLAS